MDGNDDDNGGGNDDNGGDDNPDDGAPDTRRRGQRTKMALHEFGAYLIMLRNNAHDSLIHSGKLFQEWLVDTYARVESNRLTWHRDNQDRIRSDLYQNIQRAAANGTIQARELGTKVILPSSFTGGPRYMMREYQDAMAIVRGKSHGLRNIINNMGKVVNYKITC